VLTGLSTLVPSQTVDMVSLSPVESIAEIQVPPQNLCEMSAKADELKGNGDIDGFVFCYRTLVDGLHDRLKLVMQKGLDEEKHLLLFADTLVGLIWPSAAGNPRNFETRRHSQESFCGRIRAVWSIVDVTSRDTFLWALRTSVAGFLAVWLVISIEIPQLRLNEWIPVVAIFASRRTFGEALQTSWFVISGGVIAALITMPFVQYLQPSVAVVGLVLAIFTAIILFLFLDSTQGRFGLIVLLKGLFTFSVSHHRSEAISGVLDTVLAFLVGSLIALLPLLFPYPERATRTVRCNVVEGFRLASRLHAMLAVGALQPEVPHVLHNRAEGLLQKLALCKENAEKLVEFARWEPLGRRQYVLLKNELSLLQRLTGNLQLRYEQRHQCPFKPSPEVTEMVNDGVKATIECLKDIAEGYVKVLLTSSSILKSHAGLRTICAREIPELAMNPKASSADVAGAMEEFFSIRMFHTEICDFFDNVMRPPADSCAGDSFALVRHLFPKVFVECVGERPFPMASYTPCYNTGDLQLSERLREVLCAMFALVVSYSFTWWPSDFLPKMVKQSYLFCPIVVVFAYQQRWQCYTHATSSGWRWLLGAGLGCMVAYCSVLLDQDREWLFALLLAFGVFVGTLLQSSQLGVAGLAMALTSPITALPYWPNGFQEDGLGEGWIVQSCTAIFVILAARAIVQPMPAQQLLRVRLASSLEGVMVKLRELQWGTSSQSSTAVLRRHREERGDLHIRIVDELGQQVKLLTEVVGEPVWKGGAGEASGDISLAVKNISQMWVSMLQLDALLAFGSGSSPALVGCRDHCKRLVTCIMVTVSFMTDALKGGYVKLPASLFQLISEAKVDRIDLDAEFSGEAVMLVEALWGRMQELNRLTSEMAWQVLATTTAVHQLDDEQDPCNFDSAVV